MKKLIINFRRGEYFINGTNLWPWVQSLGLGAGSERVWDVAGPSWFGDVPVFTCRVDAELVIEYLHFRASNRNYYDSLRAPIEPPSDKGQSHALSIPHPQTLHLRTSASGLRQWQGGSTHEPDCQGVPLYGVR
jgi:hypothetical protein